MCFGVVLLGASQFSYAQQPPAQAAGQQDSAQEMTPISEQQMDALADKLVSVINSKRFSAVTVFGGLGPVDELTTLGPVIGDALSAALARRAQGFRVIDRSALRERLRQERVSDAMLLTNSLAAWISRLMKAQGFVFMSFEFITPVSLTLKVTLTKASDPEGTILATISFPFVLDATQFKAVKKHIYPFATLRDEDLFISDERDLQLKSSNQPSGESKATDASCEYCPRPEYPEWARSAKIQGIVGLTLTVMPDGRATDISVVRPGRFGFDEASVIVIQTWKFKPARDKDGNLISRRIPVEITCQLY